MKRSYVIYILLLISLIFTILIWQKDIISASFNSKIKLDEVSLLNEVSNGTSFAMYYETQQDDGTYTYVESEDTTWPTDLRYNFKKSGCIDNNGNKIDGTLTYNKENNKVTLRTKSATLCYLYFDLGTEEKPYKIQYIEDLVDLSNKVNKGETYEDAYFTLEKNLDFKQEESYRQYDRTDYGDINGVDGTEPLMTELTNPEGTGFTPIGVGSTDGVTNRFNGNFNGQDFTLSNLYVNVTDMHAGLFGLVGKAGSTNTIKNLTITGNITKNGTKSHAGGLAASSSASNLIIENVHNKANVKNSNNYTGGIIAYVSENINLSNSSNEGNIVTNIGDVGGLVGGGLTSSNININNSHNYGEIKLEINEATTSSLVGGLIGYSAGTLTIEESSNEIETDNDEAGINVIYNGTSEVAVGGLIGYGSAKSKTINKSYNTSNISVQSEATSGEGTNIGGLIGRQVAASTIGAYTNNYNTGKIEVTSTGTTPTRVGGIVGWKSNGELTIDNNYNEGIINVNAKQAIYTGGIIGVSQTTPITITNSHNLGEINSKNTDNFGNIVGGIIGFNYNSGTSKISKVENSYNKGNINGGTRTGGIVGETSTNSKILINKCYNTGNVTGQEDTKYTLNVFVGGIVSSVWENSVSYILNSYNTGTLTSKVTITGNYISGIGTVNNASTSSTLTVVNSYNLGNILSKDSGVGISDIKNQSNLKINNVYNAGNIEGTEKYSVVKNTSTGSVDIQNTYYKEVTGITESNKGDIGGAYPITDANMKGTDNNSLLYKLNTNVVTLNNQGLTTYSEDLKDYTLVDWIIDPNTGYPTLNFKLEGNE